MPRKTQPASEASQPPRKPRPGPAKLPPEDTAETWLTGQMLIAMPAMTDQRFSHSLIYICAHTRDGAMGIVVNRPVSKPSFPDLLLQLDVGPVPPSREIPMCGGGPVDGARGFVLHSTDWDGEGSMRIDDATALTASLDVLKAIAGGGGPRDCILALGYAGWGAGQLDQEIQGNTWLTAPPDRDLLFDVDHATKWRRALAKLKVNPLQLSTQAGRA